MEQIKLKSVGEIGALVKETRKQQGISQEKLAGVAATGTRFISDLENGKPTIELEKAIRIANQLGLDCSVTER